MASPDRPHPPSQARALIQEAKSGHGRPLRELIVDAGTITDPSFSAEALFALSQDQRLNTNQAAAILDDVLAAAAKVERGFRKAELLQHLARRGSKWREGPTAAGVRNGFQERIVALVLEMPPGQALSSAIQGIADAAPAERLQALLGQALANPGFEVEDAKAVLKAAAAVGAVAPVVARLQTCPDAGVRARLLGALHHHLAKRDPAYAGAVLDHALNSAARVNDATVRLEIMRSLIASTENVAALHRIVAAANDLPAEPQARTMAAAGGRADRLRDAGQARAWLEQGQMVARQIADVEGRAAVEANLRAGLDRLAGPAVPPMPSAAAAPPSPAPWPAAENQALPTASAPISTTAPPAGESTAPAGRASARHVLALYDTYEGGLKEVHIRAIARAAPLCYAFDLDLALLGFPAKDAAALAKEAASETNIGDGGRYLTELVAAGRVMLVPCTTKDPPADWSDLGLPVATTSGPAAGKEADLESALAMARRKDARRICLIMGLGKRGLPPSLLRMAPLHLELTGRNVSMETATAMGVMAERLRSLPPV